jgi:hypothetical protein
MRPSIGVRAVPALRQIKAARGGGSKLPARVGARGGSGTCARRPRSRSSPAQGATQFDGPFRSTKFAVPHLLDVGASILFSASEREFNGLAEGGALRQGQGLSLLVSPGR